MSFSNPIHFISFSLAKTHYITNILICLIPAAIHPVQHKIRFFQILFNFWKIWSSIIVTVTVFSDVVLPASLFIFFQKILWKFQILIWITFFFTIIQWNICTGLQYSKICIMFLIIDSLMLNHVFSIKK